MVKITLSDLISQETKRNLIPFYARLREQEPLIYIPDDLYGMGRSWMATTYDDAVTILKDPRFTKDKRKVLPPQDEQSATQASMFQSMITLDPPDHTRLRGLVSKAFTPRIIEQLRPHIQQVTSELLDAVQPCGQMDLIHDFASLLPIAVIGEMLGVPATDRQQFRTWTQTVVNASPQQAPARRSAVEAFRRYIQTLLAEKRAHPGSDLTSSLVSVEENGEMLSEHELREMIFLLLVAGNTTVNLISTGTLALLQHPDQMHQLQRHPSLIHSAIEELLRYTAPLSLSDERWATEDIALHGKVIRKGEKVFASLIAANTDPQQFPDPERLDIARQGNQHLAFGKGIHSCLGASLARLEGQIALGTLLQRLPNLRLASDPEQLIWNSNPMWHGLTSLPVTF